jgi:hypothetical protein
MKMSESDLEKELKKFDKDLDVLIAIKEKIETAFCKSKETEKNQEREFQLQMFEVQRGYDTINSVLTVVMAVGYSFIVAITTILFAVSLPQFAQTVLIVAEVVAVSLSALSSYLLVRYHKSVPNKLANIRRQFIEKNEQKDKQ